MDDAIRKIKSIASALIDSEDVESVTAGAQLFQYASEIQNKRAQTKKIAEEIKDSTRSRKTKDLKEYIALLAPIVTTVVLAGTLLLQSYQFQRTERDKDMDIQRQRKDAFDQAKRQAEAAEDTSWADSLKLLTTTEKLSPAAVLLRRYANSPRYAAEARITTERLLLLRAGEPEAFHNLFGSVFVPVKWENLAQVVEIDSQLYQQETPLLAKAWDQKTGRLNWTKLNLKDKNQYDSLESELKFISEQIALLLKQQRPPGERLELRSTAIWNTDLQGADLSGADITGANFANVDLTGANLSGITKYDLAFFPNTAWWDCGKVSHELRQYLEANYPFDPIQTYASGRQFTKLEYETALKRLLASEN
jgi:hypothetical protein